MSIDRRNLTPGEQMYLAGIRTDIYDTPKTDQPGGNPGTNLTEQALTDADRDALHPDQRHTTGPGYVIASTTTDKPVITLGFLQPDANTMPIHEAETLIRDLQTAINNARRDQAAALAARKRTNPHPAVQAAANAISARLDLDRWEREGWPTIADDLAAAAVPAVLRAAAQHQRDHANRIHEMAPDDQWLNGARSAAAILDSLAARLEP